MNRVVILAGAAAAAVALGVVIAPLFSPSSVEVERAPDGAVEERAETRSEGRSLDPPRALDASIRTVPAEAPARPAAREEEAPPPPAAEGESALAGLEVDEANAGVLLERNVPEGMTGVIVTSVHPASPAAEAALEKGDVIVRAQRDKISTPDSLRIAVGDRDHTVLTVYRGGYPFQVVLHKPFKGDR